MSREAQLEKALRDLLMEPSGYTRQAAYKALGLCWCGRDSMNRCSMCEDGRREDREDVYR